MSDFNKDDYLNDLPDMDNLSGQAGPAAGASQESQSNGDSAATASADSVASETAATAANAASSESQEIGDTADSAKQDGEDTLTPLGQAKKEAAEYLDCDIAAVITADAKLCSELLEGLGLRKPNRANAKAIATLADLIQEALEEKSVNHGTRPA